MQDGHDILAKENVAKYALKVDDQFPHFSLPTISGEEFNSEKVLKDKRYLIVSFYRGGWCPYCQRELQALNESLKDFQNKGAALIAITPEKSSKAQETQSEYAPDIEIVHDDKCSFAKKLGLAFDLPENLQATYREDLDINLENYNGKGDFKLPVPATYILDSNHKIIKSHIDIDYKKRLDPQEILDFLSEQKNN